MSSIESVNEHQEKYYWLASDSDVARAADNLGISLLSDDIEELGANYSRVFVYHADGGKRVLKIRAQWMTEKRIRFEHTLAEHLRDRGMPIVVPMSNEQGNTWLKIGDFYIEVAPFIDGIEISPTANNIYIFGTLLGDFHRQCCDFDTGFYEAPHFQNQGEPLWLEPDIMRLHRQMKTSEANRGSMCQEFEKIQTICLRWKELVDLFSELDISSFPQVLRHGDFHPWNLLLHPTEPSSVAALFDFDMSAYGPRITDISYSIMMLRRLFLGWKSEDWENLFHQFIDGYIQANETHITKEEISAIPLLIECIAFQFLIYQIMASGMTEAVNEYDEYMSIILWLKSLDLGI